VLDPLAREDLDGPEMLTVVLDDFSWAQHVAGYELLEGPVLADGGRVHELYSARAYDVLLIDREGKIAASWHGVTDMTLTAAIRDKARELLAL